MSATLRLDLLRESWFENPRRSCQKCTCSIWHTRNVSIAKPRLMTRPGGSVRNSRRTEARAAATAFQGTRGFLAAQKREPFQLLCRRRARLARHLRQLESAGAIPGLSKATLFRIRLVSATPFPTGRLRLVLPVKLLCHSDQTLNPCAATRRCARACARGCLLLMCRRERKKRGSSFGTSTSSAM